MRPVASRVIEWPPESGRRAAYDQHDLDLLNGLREQLDRNEITPESWMRQVSAIHDLKVELAAELVEP